MHPYGLGCLPSLPDPRDWAADRLFTAPDPAALPSSVDRRRELPACWDQGGEGSCTAFASGAAYRHARRRHHGWPLPAVWAESIHYGPAEDYTISFQTQYWFSRALEGTTGSDSGASIRDAITALHQFGACAWHNYPYVPGAYAQQPPTAAMRNAGHHEILAYAPVDPSLAGLKGALASAFLPVIGILAYREIFGVGLSGDVPLPALGEQPVGGHALCVVGYDDAHGNLDGSAGAFLVRNSWSPAWGMDGHGWFPYAYLTNPQLCFEVWAIDVGAA